jgi:hypothetical protein
MGAITFDTLAYATKLKSAGFTEEQAAAITDLQLTASEMTLEQARHDYHLDDISTKRDLKETEAVLKRDIKEMDTSLRHDIKEIETRLKHDIEILRADTGRMIAETNQHIAETKSDLTRWIIAAGVLQTSIITAVLMKVAHLI